jgi:hypothetical protein
MRYRTIILSVVLYWYKLISLLREEHSFIVFEKEVLRGILGSKTENETVEKISQ